MESSEPAFLVLFGDEPVVVAPHLHHTLAKLFIDHQKEANLPANINWKNCKFYRLRNPVTVNPPGSQSSGSYNGLEDEVKKACLDKHNTIEVNALKTKVCQLADTFSNDFFYLVIELPNLFQVSSDAISGLQQNYGILFSCLYIAVRSLGKWCNDDVEDNLQGGIFTEDDDLLPDEFREIQNALAQKRVYKVTDDINQQHDFQNARRYRREFDRVFEATTSEAYPVRSHREFAAFHSLLRSFAEDAELIAHGQTTSSSLKTSNFTVHFIQPPFFSNIKDNSRGFLFQQEKGWGFTTFVGTTPDAARKFAPKSDWAVLSPDFKIPFIISEVISMKTEEDRFRMLVQAIALARAGQFLMRAGSQKRFFVIAIYVDAGMIASRYIVMQTGDTTQDNKPVTIHQKDFDLKQLEQEVDFLREMYNLATLISALSGNLDRKKKTILQDIRAAASKVLSLTPATRQQKTPKTTAVDTIAEGRSEQGELQDENDLGVFEDEDIQSILRQMHYRVEYIPDGHPRIAVIVNDTTGGKRRGFLKFTDRQTEVDVLQYLTGIDSPSNHTISGVQFWPVSGGTVISMPVAGGWLTSLRNPTRNLWPVAPQFIEAVAFIHEHNVAHMDLKPQNVIIPLEGGRLSIIDFSVSIRVRTPDTRYSGIVGTDDYIAPEVHGGLYKPMVADLWSCGRTLEKLCACCRPSADRTTLLEIAQELMNKDPNARPTMSSVLERMAGIRRGEG